MEKELVSVCAMRGRYDVKILHPVRTDYGKNIRKDYERGRIKEKRASIQRLEPKSERISNTITTVQKDNLYIAKVKIMKHEKFKGFIDTKAIKPEVMQEIKEQNRDAAIDYAISEEPKTVEDYLYHAKDGEDYGIFKLSPRECLRLMDVKDSDIDKMMAVNSNSQCYKQAGNSIAVNVLVAIFGQLFDGKEDVYKEG